VEEKTSSGGTTRGSEWSDVQGREELVGDTIDQRAGDDGKEDTGEDGDDPLLLVAKLGNSCKGKVGVHFDET